MKNHHSPILEACVETPEQAFAAEKAGAHRLEYCSRLDLDGLTPTVEEIKETMLRIQIPIKVMIRNKSGDFTFNDSDMKEMKKSIGDFRKIGVDQYVVGAINRESLHQDQIKELVDANPNGIYTVHKAIDIVNEPLKEIALLKQIPQVKYILSSGQSSTAIGGLEMLKKMITHAHPEIRIIVAGKVTRDNFRELHEQLRNTDYHGKVIVGAL